MHLVVLSLNAASGIWNLGLCLLLLVLIEDLVETKQYLSVVTLIFVVKGHAALNQVYTAARVRCLRDVEVNVAEVGRVARLSVL
jgi:hypothetical protein